MRGLFCVAGFQRPFIRVVPLFDEIGSVADFTDYDLAPPRFRRVIVEPQPLVKCQHRPPLRFAYGTRQRDADEYCQRAWYGGCGWAELCKGPCPLLADFKRFGQAVIDAADPEHMAKFRL